MRVLITGCAGFIGYHVAKYLLDKGMDVTGVDNLNSYYDIFLKLRRLHMLESDNFCFHNINVNDIDDVSKYDVVIHLAAQAGVRYSMQHPEEVMENNIAPFNHLAILCAKSNVKLIFASSSSVYGNMNGATKENVILPKPESIYALTKKSNEEVAEILARTYDFTAIGLRFFSVYGEYGRPDMAYYLFTDKLLKGEELPLFNEGKNLRDYTYVDDVVKSLYCLLLAPLRGFYVFNVGNGCPISINTLAQKLCKLLKLSNPKIKLLPPQSGDVYSTFADCSSLYDTIGFKPKTCIDDGLSKFVSWYISL